MGQRPINTVLIAERDLVNENFMKSELWKSCEEKVSSPKSWLLKEPVSLQTFSLILEQNTTDNNSLTK